MHFTGKQHDSESNLDDFDARYYSSQWGRFISADWSAVPAPVPYANLANPQTLNLYAIVADNPDTFADLDGHMSLAQSGQGPTPPFDCSFIGGPALGTCSYQNGALESNVPDIVWASEAIGNSVGQYDPVLEEETAEAAALDASWFSQAQQQITSSYKPDGGNETVGEIAGRVCGETCGMKDSKSEDESLANARDKIAHVRLNGIKKWGNNVQKHASLAAPVMRGAGYKASLQAVMNAVREDLKGVDPTNGAIFYNMRTPAQAAGMGQFQGEDVHSVSGPYASPSKYNYIVTYGGPGP